MKKLNADERIQRAIIGLLRNDPLYADYLLRWPRNMMQNGTMCVNGRELRYCPDFVDTLSDGGLRVVLKHEVMHVILKHTIRAEGYNAAEMMKSEQIGPQQVHELMNVAGDLEINDLLLTEGDTRAHFPENGLRTGVAPYLDHPARECMEAHYDILRGKVQPPKPTEPPKEQQPDGEDADDGENEQDAGGDPEGGGDEGNSAPDDKNDTTGQQDAPNDGQEGNGQAGNDEGKGSCEPTPNGFGGMGEFMPDPDATTPEEAEMLSQEYDQQLIGAVMAAQSQGKAPGWAKELVDEITAPAKVPWQVLLRRWARKVIRGGESTFSRPSRRSMYRTDLVLPSKRTNSIRRVMVIADTSGSMATGSVNAVMPECLKIMQAWKHAELILVQCDAAVADEATYKPRSGFKDLKAFAKSPQWKGRGGTDMSPAFKLVTKYKPEVIICLTDGYMSWPDKSESNGIPVMWLMVSTLTPPWGECIVM